MAAPRPAIAVVVLSDYGGRADGERGDLRATLGALGHQAWPPPLVADVRRRARAHPLLDGHRFDVAADSASYG